MSENSGISVGTEEGSYVAVKVGRLPGKIVEIALNGERTVAAALGAAELSGVEGYEIRVNGAPAEPETTLSEGDVVLLVKKIKGNDDGCVIVRIGKLPGSIQEVALMIEKRTVADALSVAEISQESGYQIRVNGALAEVDTELHEEDTVLLMKERKRELKIYSFYSTSGIFAGPYRFIAESPEEAIKMANDLEQEFNQTIPFGKRGKERISFSDEGVVESLIEQGLTR